MYFPEPVVRDILNGIAPLVGNPRSRLWADFVNEQAIVNADTLPEVAAFMTGMQLLGEPFVFGTDSLVEFLCSCGFTCIKTAPSSLYLTGAVDPVYSVYGFCVASAAIVPDGVEDQPADISRIIPPPHTRQTSVAVSPISSR